ncbi:MAG: hypothetical protein IKM38_03495, partial [Christensenellaceae bacterium]|nr:hypothetical protein [Christensenellaceae bacterium]
SAAEYGTAKHLYMEDIPLAAKTGTSSFDSEKGYNRDAWIAAYNPEYVFCCWVGFDKTDSSHYLEQGVTGGSCPAAFAKYIFSEIYKEKTAPDFPIPYGIESAEIDKYILDTQKRTVLSTEQSIETFTEFFTRENLPKETALYFSQEPPSDFKAEWQNFYPIVSFTGQKDLVYALYRQNSTGTRDLLCRITGTGTLFSYMDFSAEKGESYTYLLQQSLPTGAVYTEQENLAKGAASVLLSHPDAEIRNGTAD